MTRRREPYLRILPVSPELAGCRVDSSESSPSDSGWPLFGVMLAYEPRGLRAITCAQAGVWRWLSRAARALALKASGSVGLASDRLSSCTCRSAPDDDARDAVCGS